MLDWWDLPGPDRYLSQVAHDLRNGVNVILELPEHVPDGLRRALRRRLPAGEGVAFEHLSLNALSVQSPLTLLFERYFPDATPSISRSAQSVVECAAFGAQIIWVDGITSQSWPPWSKFLDEYHRACHAAVASSYATFCVPLIGDLAESSLGAHSQCLRIHRWQGRIHHLDMLLYAAARVPEDSMTALQREVAVAVIANLALWDPAVVHRLCEQPLQRIFSPEDTLSKLARERNWSSSEMADCDSTWHNGTQDNFDNSMKAHSAWLCQAGEIHEVRRRIWRGQVAILFPFIEERRQDLLRALAAELILPSTKLRGDRPPEVINQANRLEIADLRRQLSQLGLRHGTEIGAFVEGLERMRNGLAHFADTGVPISAEQLSTPEMKNWQTVLDRFVASRPNN